MRSPKLLAGLAVAGVVLAACGTNNNASGGSKGTIYIGVDLPESGAEQSNGIPTLNGVKFAVQSVGSVDGFKLQVDNLDDAVNGLHNPQKGAQNIESFVNNSNVLAVIGPFNSGVAAAEIPVSNRAYLVQISPANANQCLTQSVYLSASLTGGAAISCQDGAGFTPQSLRPTGVNNYFRVATTDNLQGPAMADYAFNTLHLTKVAVLDDDETYGKGIATTFAAKFKADGGSVVYGPADIPNPSSVSDFRTYLNRAKNGGAQGIYFGGTDSNNACVPRDQQAGVGLSASSVPYMGGDGIVTGECIKQAASFAPGMYGTVATVDADKVPAAASIISNFKKAFPNASDYGAYTMPAYDATQIAIQAIKKAIEANGGKLPTKKQVLDQMSNVSYDGALGHTSFDSNGDTTNKVITIYTVKNASTGWEFAASITESSS